MPNYLKKSLELIERTTVIQGVMIGAMIMVGIFLEAFGIGLLFPFIKFVADPVSIHQFEIIGRLFGPVANGAETKFLVTMAFGVIGVFLIKNLLLFLNSYVQARFIAKNESFLAQRLFKAYIRGAYSMHLTRNSADFLRTINASVPGVFSGVFINYITLITECLLVAALAMVLLIVKPIMTLSAITVLGSSVGLYYLLVRRQMKRLGHQDQLIQGSLLKALQQGLHNIKEVKVLGREQFILRGFATEREEMARIKWLLRTIQASPRLWIELVMVTFTLGVVIFFLLKGDNSGEIFAALAVFAAAGVRLIPSMNRILNSLSFIRISGPTVDLVHDDLTAFDANPDPATINGDGDITFDDKLVFDDISFFYDRAHANALNGINLEIHRGQSVGLVGPSGAGKTTLVDLLLGILSPTGGRILVDGQDIQDAMGGWRRQIGYVPQLIYLIDDTLRRNIAFGLPDDKIDEAAVRQAVKQAQLEDMIAGLPDGLDTMLGERGVRVSGGQGQRIGIARALYRNPPVLILDEATSSLDTEIEHEITKAIENLRGDKTLIIIAHRLSTVRNCDQLVLLRDGRVADIGTFEELDAANKDFSRLVELSRV